MDALWSPKQPTTIPSRIPRENNSERREIQEKISKMWQATEPHCNLPLTVPHPPLPLELPRFSANLPTRCLLNGGGQEGGVFIGRWLREGVFFTGGWLEACKVCLTGLVGCKGAVKCSEARWWGSGYRGKGTSGRSWHRELAHTPQHMNTHRQTNTNGAWADKITTRYFSK